MEGFLGEKYGRNWNIVADTYYDIFSCIDANYPGFKKDLVDLYSSGGDISVQVGSTFVEEAEELLHPIGKDTIIIAPIVTGSKSGEAKILVAIAIVAFMILLPPLAGAGAGTIGAGLTHVSAIEFFALQMAVSLAVTGIQQILAPDPSVDQNDTNYLFNGPENTTVSGNPVPVLCGEMMVGGIIISSGVIGSDFIGDGTYVHNPGPDDVPTIFSTGTGTFDGFGSAATDGLIAAQQDALAEEALRLRYRGDVN